MTPHWPGRAGNASRSSAQRRLVVREQVGVGAGGRLDAAAVGLLVDRLPHLVLGDAADERVDSRAPAPCAGAAPARPCAPRRRTRPSACASGPTSTQLTGIGVRDCGATQHGQVEDPVLLRADELLAVVEQHALVERVLDHELGHRPVRPRLGHAQAAAQAVGERRVRGLRVAAREERDDGDASVDGRLVELGGQGDRHLGGGLLGDSGGGDVRRSGAILTRPATGRPRPAGRRAAPAGSRG